MYLPRPTVKVAGIFSMLTLPEETTIDNLGKDIQAIQRLFDGRGS
jgi:hypothetical protein